MGGNGRKLDDGGTLRHKGFSVKDGIGESPGVGSTPRHPKHATKPKLRIGEAESQSAVGVF
jgi:hypothetical protein